MKAGTEPSPDAAQVHLCSCPPQESAANTHKEGVFKQKSERGCWAARGWRSGQQNAGSVVGRRGGGTGAHLGGFHPTSSPSAVLMGAGQEQFPLSSAPLEPPRWHQARNKGQHRKSSEASPTFAPPIPPLLQGWLFPTAPFQTQTRGVLVRQHLLPLSPCSKARHILETSNLPLSPTLSTPGRSYLNEVKRSRWDLAPRFSQGNSHPWGCLAFPGIPGPFSTSTPAAHTWVKRDMGWSEVGKRIKMS